jgi:hypothetical protein
MHKTGSQERKNTKSEKGGEANQKQHAKPQKKARSKKER